MAIQMRRGLKKDFDPSKMLPGEWAVSIDASTSNQIVWMCFAPSVCKRMGTYEDFKAQIAEATKDIRDSYVEDFNEIKADIESMSNAVSSDKEEILIIKSDIVNTYLPQMQEYAERAEVASTNAEGSATLSRSYAIGETGTREGENADNAKYYSQQANASASSASTSANTASEKASQATESASQAANSAKTATAKASAANISASNAATSATNAEKSATTATNKASEAGTYADNAEDSALNAATSANTAGTKANEASDYSGLSKSYAVGTDGQVRENDNTDCSQYYYEQAKRISQSLSGVIPMGSIAFDGLNNTDNQKAGYLFNISNSFVSDERFTDGGGIFYGAGSNVLRTADGKWDVLAASMVSGVKGDAETEYRQGFVNITKGNVGLNNVPNVSTNNQTPTFTQSASRVNIASGEKLSVIFGKIMKWFADLKTVAFTGDYNDLSNKPKPYSLPLASSSVRGGGKIGYAANGKNYPVQLYNEQMYVNVPWTDTNTTYSAAGSGLGLMKSGGDLTISGGVAQVNDDSHNHIISNVDGLQNALDEKLAKTSDSKDNTVTFTSNDNANPTAWTDVSVLASGEKHSSVLNKVSTMFKNVRYLYKMLGTTDISAIGNGTVTDALRALNSNLSKIKSYLTTTGAANPLVKGEKFLNGGSVMCYEKNGIAYVYMEVTPSKNVANGDIVVSGLPAPLGGVLYTSLGVASGGSYTALLNNDGDLIIYYPEYVTAKRIDASFCYVVGSK